MVCAAVAAAWRPGRENLLSNLDRSLIARLPQFQELEPVDLDHVLEHARSQHFAKDTAIFEQGVEADCFFLLLDGHVRVVRTTPDGQQMIVRYISAGELLGIASALGLANYPANAVAAVDCVVLVWPSHLWAEFSGRYPAFGAATYRTVGNRLQEAHERAIEMSTEQVEQRVAHALLRLVNQTGRKTEEGILIDFPISRQDIAEMTGTTLHTVSRLLTAWEARGLVKSGRQKVTVVEPHRLLLIAEGRASKD
jgi:CRP/FNR family transcriptional regulator, nitrogen oxide reductase regulator